jgi:hypothetical protein
VNGTQWQLLIIACWTGLNAALTWGCFCQLLEIKMAIKDREDKVS